jgi:hypothetical protein
LVSLRACSEPDIARRGVAPVSRLDTMRRLLSLAVLAVLVTPASASAVRFRGTTIQGPQVRPRTLALSVDGTIEAFNMRWERWGGATAIGYGSIEWHGCTPSCGADPAHNAPGSVHLSQVHYCNDGEGEYEEGAFYSKVSVYVRKRGHLVLLYGLTTNYAPC